MCHLHALSRCVKRVCVCVYAELCVLREWRQAVKALLDMPVSLLPTRALALLLF